MFKSIRRGFAVLVVSILAVLVGASAASAQTATGGASATPVAVAPAIISIALPPRPADCSLANADAMRDYEAKIRGFLESSRVQQRDPANKQFMKELVTKEKEFMRALITIKPFCDATAQAVSTTAPAFIADPLPTVPNEGASYAEYAKYCAQLAALQGRLEAVLNLSNAQWVPQIQSKLQATKEASVWAQDELSRMKPATVGKKRR